MAGFIKDNIGDWKNIVPRIKINNTGFDSDWKRPDSGWVKTASGWKQWYAGNVADPTLVVASTTTSSATITISNYNASLTYTDLTSTAGTASRTAQTITVTGLTAGQAVTVSIRANLLGTPSELGQITTSATPDTPTFGASTNVTYTSFTVPISNYNASYTYSVTASAGTATRTGANIAVTGLSGPGATSRISVTSTTPQGRSSALGQVDRTTTALVNPTVDANTPTLTGFNILIGNTATGYTYTLTTNPALTVTASPAGSTTSFVASGATRNTSYIVSVYGTIDGYNTTTATDTITTLDLTNPALETTSTGVRSLSASITTATYNSGYTYTWSLNPNTGTLSVNGRTATWTGLSPNTSYIVSVYGTISSQNTTTATRNITTLTRWSISPASSATSQAFPGATLVKFTAAGTITYNESINSVRVAVVGGGGAGGGTALSSATWRVASGGGGGGRYVSPAAATQPAGAINVSIGAGGAVNGTAATASSYGTITAAGGGSGKYYTAITNTDWNNGATRITSASAPASPGGGGGGGSGVTRVTPTPISGVAGLGAGGGAAHGSGGPGYHHSTGVYAARNAGGGGGGASSATNAGPPNTGTASPLSWGADFDGGGIGALGWQVFDNQASYGYAGGGGAGGGVTNRGSFGGGGGGGTGFSPAVTSTAGSANTGGGGGGGNNAKGAPNDGSAGGSGVVYILIPN